MKVFDADKTRMIGLPYGEKTMTIRSAVFIQYRNVTDGQTDLLYEYRSRSIKMCYVRREIDRGRGLSGGKCPEGKCPTPPSPPLSEYRTYPPGHFPPHLGHSAGC